MTVALALLLGVIALAWTAAPLLAASEEPVPLPEGVGARQHLVARKDALYESIEDLDFEFAAGKLTEADYRMARAEITGDAAIVLRELDAESRDEALDRWIESRVAERVRGLDAASQLVCPSCRRGNPAGARFCDGCGKSLAARSCPSCRAALRDDAHFCNNCGKRM